MAETKEDRIARLRQRIAGIKTLITKAPDPERQSEASRRHGQQYAEIGKPYRWPKGVSGNPGGRPKNKNKIRFWTFVLTFLEMTQQEVELIPDEELTMAQLGARAFVLKLADGRWTMMKEMLDRELGRPREVVDKEEEEEPTLIKLPFEGP